MIAAHRLSRNFGNFPAVDSIDFDVPRGEVVGFLGPNGAGKTTTIRMIAGFLRPSGGAVTVDGLDVTSHSLDVRRRIGYLPESAPVYGEMRVSEYLRFRGRLFGLRGGALGKAVDRAVSQCWLTEVKRRPIHQLSKGFRQRVGLAAALVHDPPVLILDEPTVGLDPTQIREVRGLIRGLAGEHTVLLSTHILPEVEIVCDRMIMIARGRVRAQGTIESLRQGGADRPSYLVEVSGAGAAAAVSEVPGVESVDETTMDDGWRRLHVMVRANQNDLGEALARALAAKSLRVRELHRSTPSLEQLFVRLSAEAETDFAARDDRGGGATRGLRASEVPA